MPSPNPTGREGTDSGPTKISKNLLRCSRSASIKTFNARTLKKDHYLDELVHLASIHKLDIVCVQEHRFIHDDLLCFSKPSPGYTFITSSAWENSTKAAQGGVGILLSNKSYNSYESAEKISPRILIATFSGNPVTTIIVCYSPHNSAPEEEVTKFYEELSEVVGNVPPHNILAICGDFNAKLGSDNVKHSFHQKTNRNGEHLHDFMESFNLIATNCHLQKPKRKLWTFKYPNKTKAQLDYILVRKKWVNSVRNCEPFSTTFNSICSDHRPLSMTIKLSLRAQKPNTGSSRSINFKSLSSSLDPRQKYAVEVSNRFSSLLQEHPEEISIQDKYDCLVKSCTEAGRQMLPKKPKKKWSNLSKSENVIKARENLKEANTIGSQNNIKDAKNALQDEYKLAEKSYIEQQVKLIEDASYSSKHVLAWKVINEVTGKKETKMMGKINGTVEDRKEKWLDHFSSLLGKPPSVPTTNFEAQPVSPHELPISTSPFSESELKAAIKAAKRGGAVGLDAIPIEIWNTDHFLPYLLDLCNEGLVNHIKPSQWSKSSIVPIYKKGDTSLPSNYRGISLNAIAAKLYNKMLLNRIQPHVDKLLSWTQNGFRKSRSTLYNILTLRRIIEGLKSKNLPLAIVFIDFSKAFDSIHRERMFEILSAYGIPKIIIDAIKLIYEDSCAQIVTPDGETDFFDIVAGIFQGDTLAPFLFIVVLDYALRQAYAVVNSDTGIVIEPRNGSRRPEIRLRDSSYADDIALLNGTLSLAEELLHSVEEAASEVGLYLNASKTELLTMNIPGTDSIKSISGHELKRVDSFKYLGSQIPDSFHDFKVRKAMAWDACNKLERLWTSSLETKLKLRTFRTCVESILIYGSETWTITAKMKTRIDGCYTRLLRRALNVSWRAHMTNVQLYGELPTLSSTIRQRRMRFAGHCSRAPDQPANNLLFWAPRVIRTGHRGTFKTYSKMLQEDTGLTSHNEIRSVMGVKDNWKQRVVNALDFVSPSGD